MFGLEPGDRVLAVPPHPDDETLGAGGTIARLTEAGIEVHVLALACVTLPRWGAATNTARRRAEFEMACDVLGVAGRDIAWSDDHRARNLGAHLSELVRLLEAGHALSLAELRPEAMLIPAAGAVHQDHQAAHQGCYAAARPTGGLRHVPRLVLGFRGPEDHAWSPHSPHASVLVDITASSALKDKALNCYAGEMRDPGHPRSLDRIRAIDTATAAALGCERAEAFVPYRMAW
ncbi:PIG-L deacetylase family protein [Streptomyces sp. NPDC050161]|uniref:PIG-L deacetylase family protein n=1 Tax=Streptomyces sp. NPDC050161 TaxID=3365604 RepID=UPI0037873C14